GQLTNRNVDMAAMPKHSVRMFSSLDDLTLSLLHAQPAAARPAIPWAKAELFWVEPAPGSLLRFPTERIAHDNRCTAGSRCDLMSALGPEAEKLTTSKRLAVCTRKRTGEVLRKPGSRRPL